MSNTKGKTTDMTVGSPIRHILFFGLPIFIGNIFQQVYNLVDTMVAGYSLGDAAIAAIGATASLYALIIDLAFGLNSGYGITISHAFGAQDSRRVRQSIAGTVLLNLILTLVLTVTSLLLLRPIMKLMNTPPSVFEQAWLYIAIICGGLVSINLYNMLTSILRALGNSKTPLYFLILSSVLNILLDILLVAGLRTGIAGAAAATVASQTIAGLLCGWLFLRNYKEFIPRREDFHLSRELLGDLAANGLGMGMMYTVVDIGSVIFMSANNLLGESIITAHIAARRLIMLTFLPLGSIANANATFVGQNWGAKKVERIRSTLRKVLGMDLAWSVFAGGILFLFGGALLQLTTGTSNPEIISNGVLSIRIHASCYFELGVLLCLRTTMQAMGQKTAPILSSTAEMAMKLLSAMYFIPKFGFIATCCTEPATWVVCMVFLVVVYTAVTRRKLIVVS